MSRFFPSSSHQTSCPSIPAIELKHNNNDDGNNNNNNNI
jgi:hypothetical protein